MPLVHVRSNLAWSPSGGKIATIIADCLTGDEPEAKLDGDDIEVFFDAPHSADHSDYEVLVEIEAQKFPSREANFNERVKKIGDALQDLFEQHSIGVWVKLIDNPGWYSFI